MKNEWKPIIIEGTRTGVDGGFRDMKEPGDGI